MTKSAPATGSSSTSALTSGAEIRNRIEVGDGIIDDEYITGFNLPGMPTEIHAAVVYRVADGVIQRADLLG